MATAAAIGTLIPSRPKTPRMWAAKNDNMDQSSEAPA